MFLYNVRFKALVYSMSDKNLQKQCFLTVFECPLQKDSKIPLLTRFLGPTYKHWDLHFLLKHGLTKCQKYWSFLSFNHLELPKYIIQTY